MRLVLVEVAPGVQRSVELGTCAICREEIEAEELDRQDRCPDCRIGADGFPLEDYEEEAD